MKFPPRKTTASVALPLLLASAFAFTVTVGGIASAADATAGNAEPIDLSAHDYVPGEVLVQYHGEQLPETVALPEGADVENVADRLEDRPAVKHATPNYIAHASSWTPNDRGVNPPRIGRIGGWWHKQWNFLPCASLCYPNTGSNGHQSLGGMNVTRAWRLLRRAGRPGARGVKVAVIDSGVAYRNYGKGFRRNPDLRRRTFLPGRDFVDNDRLPLDRFGHGTHIASTIAQATNNKGGLTGIAYGAKIIPVRVLDGFGFGSTDNIIKGIYWAARNGARVINLSLNFTCGESIPPLEDALAFAHKRGVIVVGSAGNKKSETCPTLPATSPTVISVGANTESGCVSAFSFKSRLIDIAAPGGGGNTSDCPRVTGNRPILQVGMIDSDPTRYGIEPGWVGTSMAAAHVSAAAAMVVASDALPRGGKGPRRVKERLFGTARLPAHAAGNPKSGFGAGIVNLGRAVNPAVKVPTGA